MTTTGSRTKAATSTTTTAPATERPPAHAQPLPATSALLTEIGVVLARHLPADPPAAPGLTLTPRETDDIARALGLGARPTAASMLAAIDRLAAVRIGDIRIPF